MAAVDDDSPWVGMCFPFFPLFFFFNFSFLCPLFFDFSFKEMREKRGKKRKGVCGVCVRERRDLHLHGFLGFWLVTEDR